MNFVIFHPAKHLRHLVSYYWFLEADANVLDPEEYMVPDGYEEIIFNLAGGYNRRFHLGKDNQTQFTQQSFLVGSKSEGIYADCPEDLYMFGIKLWPGSLYRITGVPLTEFKEKPLTLSDINNQKLMQLQAALMDRPNVQQASLLLDDYLTSTVAMPEQNVITKATYFMFRAHGNLSIDTLTGKLHCHHRTLEKQFIHATGLRPKQLARSLRFKRAFHMLENQQYRDLNLQALGFYDQSHFIKEFRHFTGYSPLKFFKNDALQTVSRFCLDSENLSW